MAENTISIKFIADDASTTAAFSKLESQVKSATGAQAAPAQDTWMAAQTARQTAYRAELAKTQAAEEKTAAARRALPGSPTSIAEAAELRRVAEAQNEVGAATEKTTVSTRGLITAYAAYRVARAVFDAAKYVVTQQAEYEGERARFQNLAGNTLAASVAFDGLSKVARDTNSNIVDLGKAGTTISQWGVPIDDVNKDLSVMGKIAAVAGVSVQVVADAYKNLASGHVSAGDIALISGATGDTGLMDQYREMTVTIPLLAHAMELRQFAAERTRQDEDRIATRLEKDVDLVTQRNRQDRNLVATRAEQDFDRAETRGTHDLDLAQTRAQQDRDRQERRDIEAWQGRMNMGQMARGPIGPRFPGGFTPDEGPLQQETYSKFGKGGFIIEGSYERKQREEKNRAGFAKEDQAREDRKLKEQRDREDRDYELSTAREDRNLVSGRGRQDVDQKEERALVDRDLMASRMREDAAIRMSQAFEDERRNLALRAYLIEQDLIAKGKAGLTTDTATLEKEYANYRATMEAKLKALEMARVTGAQGMLPNIGEGLKSIGNVLRAPGLEGVKQIPSLFNDFTGGVSDITNTALGTMGIPNIAPPGANNPRAASPAKWDTFDTFGKGANIVPGTSGQPQASNDPTTHELLTQLINALTATV